MSLTLAFDVYGTLIDTNGVFKALQSMLGADAGPFMKRWREKQLEYSFRRGLMKVYADFSVCTRQALEYCCLEFGVPLSRAQQNELLEVYTGLPAFPDAGAALQLLGPAGHRAFAFSNGSRAAVEQLLAQAGLLHFFEGIISAENVQTFKPDPAVYAHFMETTAAQKADSWLISGNPFDIGGAGACGLRTAWIRRGPEQLFDPWGPQPDLRLSRLDELPSALRAFSAGS